jgi:hypothetical protein
VHSLNHERLRNKIKIHETQAGMVREKRANSQVKQNIHLQMQICELAAQNINCNQYYINARFSVFCMQVKEMYLKKRISMQRIEKRVSLLNAHSRQTHIAIFIYA